MEAVALLELVRGGVDEADRDVLVHEEEHRRHERRHERRPPRLRPVVNGLCWGEREKEMVSACLYVCVCVCGELSVSPG